VLTKCIFVDFTRIVINDFAVDDISQPIVHIHSNRVGHTNEQVDKETSFPDRQNLLLRFQ